MTRQTGDSGSNWAGRQETSKEDPAHPGVTSAPSAEPALSPEGNILDEPTVQDRVNAIRGLQQDRVKSLMRPVVESESVDEADPSGVEANTSTTDEEFEGTYAATAGDIAIAGSSSDRDLGLLDDTDLDATERGMLENAEEEHIAHEIHEQHQRLFRELGEESPDGGGKLFRG